MVSFPRYLSCEIEKFVDLARLIVGPVVFQDPLAMKSNISSNLRACLPASPRGERDLHAVQRCCYCYVYTPKHVRGFLQLLCVGLWRSVDKKVADSGFIIFGLQADMGPYSAVPCSAWSQFIAVYDLVLQCTALSRDSSGFHFSARVIYLARQRTNN